MSADSNQPRIVIKLGTGILTRLDEPLLDEEQFSRITREVAELVSEGNRCLLVSSGAVGAGLHELGLKSRPPKEDLAAIQACAAVGQCRLMHLYESNFRQYGLSVAQLLLSYDDLDSRSRFANIQNTLNKLFAHPNVVPIVNENDPVAVEELRFGDNDQLSAEVAILARASKLIICTSANGLTRNPDGTGEPIPVVEDIDVAMGFAGEGTGRLSVGGMRSKLQAVRRAVLAGVPAVIVNGRTPGLLKRIVRGESVGTSFPVAKLK